MKQRIAKIIFVCLFVAAALAVAAGPISCGGKKGTLSEILIFPANPSIARGYPLQLYGQGILSNGVTYVMTVLSWSSSSPDVATVSAAGIVTAVSNGTTTITATESDSHMNLYATTIVTVEDIASIAVTPVEPSMAIGAAMQFISKATLTSGAVQDLSLSLTWSSSDTGIATVTSTPGASGNGVVFTGNVIGETFITATDLISGISGTVKLTVTATSLASLAVTPADTSMQSGPTSTRKFTATGTYGDGIMIDITSSMTWTTSNDAIATIISKPGTAENGLVTAGTATGTVTITATDPVTTRWGSTSLTVN